MAKILDLDAIEDISQLSEDSSIIINKDTSQLYRILLSTLVQNSLDNDSTNLPLSAAKGKELKQSIDNLKSIGRFLSLWNCKTGLPSTNPSQLPYAYKTGDYYIVGEVDSTTNYIPNGSSYTGDASVTTTTDDVKVDDLYLYDGNNWILLDANSYVISLLKLRVPFTIDKDGNPTAITLGNRGYGDIGPHSLSIGVGNVLQSSYVLGIGSNCLIQASANYSIALGYKPKVAKNHKLSFVWNGIESNNPYTSNNSGTFNINPVGGLDGFYIGNDKLSDILNNTLNGVINESF